VNEASILAKLPRRHRNLILGIGDDAAIYRPKSNEDLVFTTDLFIEGVHFKSSSDAGDVGRRALARSLSDIAAMGARPQFCLVSLALPREATEQWISDFFSGLLDLAKQTKTALAGGDLSDAEFFTADVMICGSVPRGKALRRDGARPGDSIYVSGPLGGWRHRESITPRLAEGRQLLGKATACMDISDGLALDLHRLCLASKVSAALNDIPILEGATIKEALHDGEDYELLYTSNKRVPGHLIGAIQKGTPGAITLQGKPLEPLGYDHFRTRT
jgi:thiamine-monophosphate kinase